MSPGFIVETPVPMAPNAILPAIPVGSAAIVPAIVATTISATLGGVFPSSCSEGSRKDGGDAIRRWSRSSDHPESTPAVGLREAAQHVERTTRREQHAAALAAADEDNLTTRALLSVVSDRGGDIYIDGRRAGPSPLSVTVPPGRHVLANGSGDDAASLTIDIGRGERRRVVLR